MMVQRQGSSKSSLFTWHACLSSHCACVHRNCIMSLHKPRLQQSSDLPKARVHRVWRLHLAMSDLRRSTFFLFLFKRQHCKSPNVDAAMLPLLPYACCRPKSVRMLRFHRLQCVVREHPQYVHMTPCLRQRQRIVRVYRPCRSPKSFSMQGGRPRIGTLGMRGRLYRPSPGFTLTIYHMDILAPHARRLLLG